MKGGKVGRRLRSESSFVFRGRIGGSIVLGNNVYLGRQVEMQVFAEGKIILKDNVRLGTGVILSATTSIEIGESSGVAEYVSIRDHVHGAEKGRRMWEQELISEAIIIGEDVQIGKGAYIDRGVQIPNGVIIGPNSVVTRGIRLKENVVVFGIPAKIVSERSDVNR